jgi:hypothetical protein
MEREGIMKSKLLIPPLAVLGLLVFSVSLARSQTVITFDDIASPPGGAFITNGYQGLIWSNFATLNAVLQTNLNGANGYGYGMVSPSNVAFNADGTPAEIDSPGTNFNFLSAYLTGAWNSNLNIEVQGYRGTNLIYDETVVSSATNPTLFTFNYSDIDRLDFNSYGGEPAFTPFSETPFAMDNMTVEFVPEPSSLLLAAMGAATLCAVIKRKRS